MMVEVDPRQNAVEFVGLEPWPTGIEVIECVAGGTPIDLHNDCALTETVIGCAPKVDLSLRFVRDDDGAPLTLVFSDVRQLRFVESECPSEGVEIGWSATEVSTFYGVEYQARPDGSGGFALSTIVGDYSFICRRVVLRLF